MRQQVKVNTIGVIELYTPEGRPDADGACTVFISGSAPLVSGLTATVDPASTSLTVTAEINSRRLDVASAANFKINNSYVLANQDGRTQRVQVAAKGPSALFLDELTEFEMQAPSSTVKAHRLTVTIPAENTTIRYRRLRADFSYAVDGVTYYKSVYFDIVSEPFYLGVDERFIEDIYPDFGQAVGGLGIGAKIIRSGERFVWAFLEGLGKDPDEVRDKTILKLIAAYKTLELWWMLKDQDRAERMKDMCVEQQDNFLRSPAWIDLNDNQVREGGGSDLTPFVVDGVTYYPAGWGEEGNEVGSEGDEVGVGLSYVGVG